MANCEVHTLVSQDHTLLPLSLSCCRNLKLHNTTTTERATVREVPVIRAFVQLKATFPCTIGLDALPFAAHMWLIRSGSI